MKDRDGKEVSTKEFIERWKEGIKSVSPIQQNIASLWGGAIVLIGILWGISFSLIMKQYWLSVILVGSFILSALGLYANWQKYLALKKVEDAMKQFQTSSEKEVGYIQ